MSVDPASVYLTASFRPYTFVVWSAQGPVNLEKIRTVYAYFAGSKEDYVSELLQEAMLGEDRRNVTFGVCIDT